MREQLRLIPAPQSRRWCFFCYGPSSYLYQPHAGPCGAPCFGGVTDEQIEAAIDDLDAFIEAHHARDERNPCPHCEVRNAT